MKPRTVERIHWLLRRLTSHHRGFCVAWDEEDVDAFVEAFPEAKTSLKVYTMGPNSSPTLNRTARIAHKLGYLEPGVIGNEDARSYNQRTWCRTWTLTDLGRNELID